MLEAIYNILGNSATVTAIVSARIFPLRIPINVAYPALSFQIVSDVPENNKTGRADYFNARVQINCFALNPKDALNLNRAVIKTLERKTPGVYGGIAIKNITLLGSMQRMDDSSDYDGVHYFITEFNFCHGSTS